jgi:hypothetical protein
MGILRDILVDYQKIRSIFDDGDQYSITELVSALSLTGTDEKSIRRAFHGLDNFGVTNLLEAWYFYLKEISKDNRIDSLIITGIKFEDFKKNSDQTDQTFIDLIDQAEERVLIIGYRFTEGYNNLIDSIQRRLYDRNIRIEIVTDHLMGQLRQTTSQFFKK